MKTTDLKTQSLNSHPSRFWPRAFFQKALAAFCCLGLWALCLGTLAPMTARADFSGYYPPVNWDPIYTFSDDPAPGNPSHVDTSGAPGAITLWAQQGYMWSGGTSLYLIPVPVSGTLAFDWLYTAGVPGDSCAGYAVNPAIATWGGDGQWINPGGHPGCTSLAGRYSSNTGNNTTGHVSITVNAGDMIGFWVHNAFYNSTANIRISNFTAPNGVFHPITSSVGTGGGGKISPLGTVIAPQGLNRTFTMVPSHGFIIGDVLVDGTSVGAVASYSFTNVTTDGRTIEARFTSLTQYTIVPAAGAGGTISPSTTVTLYQGDSQAFTITPAPFFDVFRVILDAATTPADVTNGPAAQSYNVAGVTASHTIDASFVEWVSSEIAGTVTSGGTPLAGVLITVAGNRGPFSATTGADGKYAIRVRPGDSYTVTAYKAGYISDLASLTAAGGDTGKDFTLTVNPPHKQPMFVNRGTGGWRGPADYWTIGTRIHTGASSVYVSKLGFVDHNLDGLNVTHQVGIWDMAGTLLGSVTVPLGTNGELIGDFRYAPLDTVIVLAANTSYAVGGFTQGDDWGDSSPTPGFNEPDFVGFTSESAIAHDGSAGFSNPNPNGGGFDWGSGCCAAVNVFGTIAQPGPHITGLVTLGDGTTPVAGATVSCTGKPDTTTLADGSYSIPVILGDVVTVSAAKSGFVVTYPVGNSYPITVSGDSTGINFKMGSASPFGLWIGQFFGGSTHPLIVGQAADPDGDGQNNLLEFALGGTPNNGARNAQVYSFSAVSAEFGSANKVLVLTIAVRTNTPAFAGSPAVAVHPTDGVKYTVRGGLNLALWDGTIYSCVNAILPAGVLPGTAGPGYEYRSFILQSSDALHGKGFLQVKVEANP